MRSHYCLPPMLGYFMWLIEIAKMWPQWVASKLVKIATGLIFALALAQCVHRPIFFVRVHPSFRAVACVFASPAWAKILWALITFCFIGWAFVLSVGVIWIPTNFPAPLLIIWSNLKAIYFLRSVRKYLSFLLHWILCPLPRWYFARTAWVGKLMLA